MIICVVGKTSSGKDTVARIIKDKYNIDMVVSYSTAKRRPDQIEGVHHYFITDEKMEELKNNASIIAYTKNEVSGIQYCATLESIKSDICVYIINPNGIDYMRKNNFNDFVSIYVDCKDSKIIIRGTKRGDSILKLSERLSLEKEEWENFRDTKQYDYYIDNSGSYDDLVSQVDRVMNDILNK